VELFPAKLRPIETMKTIRLFLTALAGLAAAHAGFAAGPAASPDNQTEVIFSHPEKFADVRNTYAENDKDRDAILAQLKDYLVQRSKDYIPAGQKLVITVTDVDMAGDFEPWRGPQMTDVRIVKDIYPPKVDLEFRLTGADGKVVKEGKRQLRDLAFMMKANTAATDNLRFEKALLDDWLRADFPRAKSG
jgi:hypothetical protein